jgi:hypothetical protein
VVEMGCLGTSFGLVVVMAVVANTGTCMLTERTAAWHCRALHLALLYPSLLHLIIGFNIRRTLYALPVHRDLYQRLLPRFPEWVKTAQPTKLCQLPHTPS